MKTVKTTTQEHLTCDNSLRSNVKSSNILEAEARISAPLPAIMIDCTVEFLFQDRWYPRRLTETWRASII